MCNLLIEGKRTGEKAAKIAGAGMRVRQMKRGWPERKERTQGENQERWPHRTDV